MAVRWLEARGLAGAAALADLCEAPPPEAGCPIRRGAAISDAAVPALGDHSACAQPLLLVPFLACHAAPGLRLDWTGGAALIGRDGVALTGAPPPPHPVPTTLRPAPAPPVLPLGSRAVADDGTILRLKRFAARTHAPADPARRAGAGAGFLDTD